MLKSTFQSTLPHGNDLKPLVTISPKAAISIHAPLRERLSGNSNLKDTTVFQSTLPRGSDSVFNSHQSAKSRFQSTLPRGSDASFSFFFCRYSAFQSTLPHGSDQLFSLNRLVLAYFTPRSLAGATLPSVSFVLADLISIHAPSRERRIMCNPL